MKPISLVWFRQDLRLQDNPALSAALAEGLVLPLFILDDESAGDWKFGAASRWWLHHSIISLNKSLNNQLWVLSGDPAQIISNLVAEYDISNVYWNRCYEPSSIKRDKKIKSHLSSVGIEVYSFNGSLIWEPWSNLKKDGTPYKVFTPYYKNGLANQIVEEPLVLNGSNLDLIQCEQDKSKIDSLKLEPKINWHSEIEKLWAPGESGAAEQIRHFIDGSISNYKIGRDFPSLDAVSKISPYLHFGEISPRQILYTIKIATQGLGLENEVEHYQRELAWRDFSYSLLFHFPFISEKNLNQSFDNFPWQNDAEKLRLWQKGLTGYPLIDAGMRELWNTGYMHNRVRMIVGSFLVKNLLIPWQFGSKWFWDCLLDADLANNSCSWQWVAGSGADAAPYFRIFNPVTQSRRFDPEGKYIRRHIPELQSCPNELIHDPGSASEEKLRKAGIVLGENYPFPIVELKASREAALSAYKKMKSQ